ncbi:hypothetical protein PF007_g6937 [Phytophthora fragariae]|uniref:Uncharacterized protein n=1 Tax=Phytophthora fragariae TaxID=53985 RepID=A0A6A3FCC5_9STRA|nr:hypothetical protein PF009_g7485 [Phytophthora fragariae]KAE9123782.1 hypothetical protein PF007_g6937 [Phytophthora fragariae]KAE9342349.1 hypothetical protein PF008_g10202 [Phytophthora fragariae]
MWLPLTRGSKSTGSEQLLAAKDSDRLLTPPPRRRPSLHGRTVADKWSDLDLNSNQTRLPLRCHLMQLVTEDAVHQGASRVKTCGGSSRGCESEDPLENCWCPDGTRPQQKRQLTRRQGNVLCKQGRGQAMI